VRFELHGRATVSPVLGVEVLGLGDVAGERQELRTGPGDASERERFEPGAPVTTASRSPPTSVGRASSSSWATSSSSRRGRRRRQRA